VRRSASRNHDFRRCPQNVQGWPEAVQPTWQRLGRTRPGHPQGASDPPKAGERSADVRSVRRVLPGYATTAEPLI
jgi:hypothetical protein